MKYRPEIDGIRTIAVLPVILFHAGFELFSGGFVGVDVFFVISGFLITSILLRELSSGTFSLLRFYERRARRILPALCFVILCCLPVAWAWLLPLDLKDFAQSLIAVITFSSNILFWSEADYFDTTAELKPLLHTWSLAVEEQYYVFFPLLLMLLWRFGTNIVVWSLITICILSFGLAQWAANQAPTAAFYLLPFRAWELGIGALLAVHLFRQGSVKGNEALSLLGATMIAVAVFTYDHHTPFPGAYALLPTIGTALLICYTAPGTLTYKSLSFKPIVGIGLISYSAYLWHQPLFAFAQYRFPTSVDRLEMSLLSLVALGLAYLSWKYIEAPFRSNKTTTSRTIWLGTAAMALLFLPLGAIGHLRDGFPERYSSTALANFTFENRQLQQESWAPLRALAQKQGYAENIADYDRQLWPDTEKPDLLIVGNSHGKDMYNILHASAQVAGTYDIQRFHTQIGTLDAPEAPLFDAPNYKRADIIMIASRLFDNDLDALPIALERITQDGKIPILVSNTFEFTNYGVQTIADTIIFPQLIKNKAVLNPEVIVAEINAAYFADTQSTRPGARDVAAINTRLAEIAETHDVVLLDRMDYICVATDQSCFAISADLEKYFYDYGHNSLAGARFFGQRIDNTGWAQPLLNLR